MTSPKKPAHGLEIQNMIEGSPLEGQRTWIDLAEVESAEHVQRLLDCLSGKADDPHPDAWIDDGTLEVVDDAGIAHLASYIGDSPTDWSMVVALAELAEVLRALEPGEVSAFEAWACGADEGGPRWAPAYSLCLPSDAVARFRLDRAAGGPDPLLSL